MTFTELTTEVTRLGGLGDATEDSASATAWAKGGLRMIGRAAPWTWLRISWTLSLVADQYAYALSSLDTNLWRLKVNSLRYAGTTTYLGWRTPEEIDSILEPTWKDAATAGGTPQYATHFGNNLWIAGKPSAAHIASYPSLYGYGWRKENYDGALFLPDEFFEIAVEASLAYGFTEEDDPRADNYLARAQRSIREEMMGAELDVGANMHLKMPSWAGERWAGVANYGDEGGYSY